MLEYCASKVDLNYVRNMLEGNVMVDIKTKAPPEGLALLNITYEDKVYDYNNKFQEKILNEYIKYRNIKNNKNE